MAKPTIITIRRFYPGGIHVKWENSYLMIKSFNFSNHLKINVSETAMTIYDLAEFVLGCFEPQSTFIDVKQVTFTFLSATVSITHDEAIGNPAYIVNKWQKALEKNIDT